MPLDDYFHASREEGRNQVQLWSTCNGDFVLLYQCHMINLLFITSSVHIIIVIIIIINIIITTSVCNILDYNTYLIHNSLSSSGLPELSIFISFFLDLSCRLLYLFGFCVCLCYAHHIATHPIT